MFADGLVQPSLEKLSPAADGESTHYYTGNERPWNNQP